MKAFKKVEWKVTAKVDDFVHYKRNEGEDDLRVSVGEKRGPTCF
jgi:hypothetical protein